MKKHQKHFRPTPHILDIFYKHLIFNKAISCNAYQHNIKCIIYIIMYHKNIMVCVMEIILNMLTGPTTIFDVGY